MTPDLTSALGHLTTLSAPELTIIAAAAQALAAMASPATTRRLPPGVPSGPPPLDATPARAHPRHRRRGPSRTRMEFTSGAAADARTDGIAVSGDQPSIAGSSAASRAPEGLGPRLAGRGRGWLLDGSHLTVDSDLFASAAYRRRLGPSVPGLLYAAGCDGLLALAEQLGEPLYKVGTTEGLTTAMRMSTLAAAGYASVVRDDAGWREEEGFEHWRAVALPLTRRRGRFSPVGPALGAIAYQCPASLPHTALDRAVAMALAPAGLDAFATSDVGRAACRTRGIDPACLARHTPGPRGCPPRQPERARELVLLGPRADADRIAAALEAVIAAHVMGRDPA